MLRCADAAHLAPAGAGEGQRRAGDRRGRGPAPAAACGSLCRELGELRRTIAARSARCATASARMGQPGAAAEIAAADRQPGQCGTTAAQTIEVAAGTASRGSRRPANGVVGAWMAARGNSVSPTALSWAWGDRRDRAAAAAGRAAADGPLAARCRSQPRQAGAARDQLPAAAGCRPRARSGRLAARPADVPVPPDPAGRLLEPARARPRAVRARRARPACRRRRAGRKADHRVRRAR